MQKKLNRNSDTTISTQLYEILRQNILENKWKENDKFFSVRQISIKYEVNPNTVLKVIQTLEEEGYLYSIKGKGCFVKKGYRLDINKRMTPILNTFRFGQNPRGMEINFSNGAPPKEYFPVSEYKKIINEILSNENESKNLMGYQNIQGLESFRTVLVDYIKKYGITTSKENIIICSGTQIALQLICTSFGISPKKTVLLSEPTYQNAVQILKNFCKIDNINLEEDGWDMLQLESLLQVKKVDFIYVMTNFQNPTGVSWSNEKKKKILELAKKYNFYIIEDDCFSDFFYTESYYPESLKAIDVDDRVFFIKTFSKIVMPAVAIAMMIPPKNFVEPFSLNKYFIDTTTSGINQKFLEIFIKDGFLDKHLEKLRKNLKEKMNYAIEELRKIKHLEIKHISQGGFFIWVELANYIDSEKFYYKCRLRGLSILPGFIFYSSSNELSSSIRISIVSSTISEMQKGLAIIQDVVNYSHLKRWELPTK